MRVEKKVCARCGKTLPLGKFMLAANDLYMKSGGSYSIVRSVHRDSVTSFNVSCENGDRHFLYTLLGADSFKLANQPPLAVIVCYGLAFNTKKQ